jgi:hypothetical protein
VQPSLLQRAVAEQNRVRHYADHLLEAEESTAAFSSANVAPPSSSERLHPVALQERQRSANMFAALDDDGDDDNDNGYKVTLQPSALSLIPPPASRTDGGDSDDDDDL